MSSLRRRTIGGFKKTMGTGSKEQKVDEKRKELLSENSYHTTSWAKSRDEAIRKCKEKVNKISKEYKQQNRMFRDRKFDLRTETAACLYSGNLANFESWKREVGRTKRVREIFKDPRFFIDNATPEDIVQSTKAQNCYFMTALSTLAVQKDLIREICVAQDLEVGVYGFIFFKDGDWISTVVDDQLLLDKKERLFFGRSQTENEIWVPLIEKAFAKVHGDYESCDTGHSGEAVEDLTGGVTTFIFTEDICSKDTFWKNTMLHCTSNYLIAASWGTEENEEPIMGLVPNHAYGVLKAIETEVDSNVERLILLRNPWGETEWCGAFSDSDNIWKSPTNNLTMRLNYEPNNDGEFWMSFDDFLIYFDMIDCTKLFRNDDWSLSTKWIRYDYPPAPAKFRLTIYHDAPTVIVLQQPDDRYTTSLYKPHGYILSFYVYEEGKSGADYIYRGRNALNEVLRSVNCQIEKLTPGTYEIVPEIERVENAEQLKQPSGSEEKDFMNRKKQECETKDTRKQLSFFIDENKDHTPNITGEIEKTVPIEHKETKYELLLGLRVYSQDKTFELHGYDKGTRLEHKVEHKDPEDNQRAKAGQINKASVSAVSATIYNV